jgi:hypothetical protein
MLGSITFLGNNGWIPFQQGFFFKQKLAKLHFAEILIFVASFNNAIETKKTSGIHKCLFSYALVIVTYEYVTVQCIA